MGFSLPSCLLFDSVRPDVSPPPSFGPTADADGGQRHRRLGRPAVAAVHGRRGRLRHHLQRRVRCVCLCGQTSLNGGGEVNPRRTCPAVSPIVEHVSGATVEFEMGSLVPGTRYKVGVHAVKDALKSNPAVTEFTTGRDVPRDAFTAAPPADLQAVLRLQMWTRLEI